MPPHPLTNSKIQKYYQSDPLLSSKNERKFNSVYPRNNLPKIKDGKHVINLDEFKSIGTHLIALFVNANNKVYCDRFGVEHISK